MELKKITYYDFCMMFKRKEFEKAVRWYLMTIFMVVGSMTFFIASAENSIKPVWIGILCFGVVFIVISVWKTIRNKILFLTFGLVVGLSFAAKYLPLHLYKATGYVLDINYYVLWSLLILVVGIPVMTIAFDKLEE